MGAVRRAWGAMGWGAWGDPPAWLDAGLEFGEVGLFLRQAAPE